MLRSKESGGLLAHTEERGLHLSDRGDDSAMWRPTDGGFTAATTGAAVEGEQVGAADALEPSCRLTGLGDELPAHFEVAFGPTRLPSSHLAELRETGFTIVPGFSPAVCAAMREAVYDSALETVVNLGPGPPVVAPTQPQQEGGAVDELRLSVPRSRRGSTGGEGIQVFRDGLVVQGEEQPATIPFDSISDATVHTDPPCVKVWQGSGEEPFAFGTADLPSAESLSARIMEVVRPEDEPRHTGGGGGSERKDFWSGERGYLFGRMHCQPVMLWLLEQSFGGPARTGGHTPNAKTIMPQDGSWGPGQGWHSVRTSPCVRLPAIDLTLRRLRRTLLTTRASSSHTEGSRGPIRRDRWGSSAMSARRPTPRETAAPPTSRTPTCVAARRAWTLRSEGMTAARTGRSLRCRTKPSTSKRRRGRS